MYICTEILMNEFNLETVSRSQLDEGQACLAEAGKIIKLAFTVCYVCGFMAGNS